MGNVAGRFAYPDHWEYELSRFDEKGKLFHIYIHTRCDIAGVHQLHYPVDSAYLGFQIDRDFVQEYIKTINDEDQIRVKPLKGARLFIVDYVRQQQKPKGGPLSAKSGPHIKVVRELRKHGIFEETVKRDPELFENYTNTADPSEIDYEYPKGSLSIDNAKPLSSSNSYSSGNGGGRGSSPPLSKGKDFSKATKLEEEMKDSGMLDDTPF